jgi:hypothetical protein
MGEELVHETCEFGNVKKEVMGTIEPALEDKKGLC